MIMAPRLDRDPAAVLARRGLDLDMAVERIAAHVWDATDAQWLAGETWYARAREDCRTLAEAYGLPLETAAGVVAALSPRTPWETNLAAAWAWLRDRSTLPRVLPSNYPAAARVLETGRPWDAPKVGSFFRNILGCRQTVTVDQWALRVAGVPEATVKVAGGYAAVAHAYALAGERCGLTPRETQAIAWVVARDRGRHAYARKVADSGAWGAYAVTES